MAKGDYSDRDGRCPLAGPDETKRCLRAPQIGIANIGCTGQRRLEDPLGEPRAPSGGRPDSTNARGASQAAVLPSISPAFAGCPTAAAEAGQELVRGGVESRQVAVGARDEHRSLEGAEDVLGDVIDRAAEVQRVV